MEGKELALIFQKTSTRTRVSFEVGIHQLGGHSIYLDWRTTNFTLGDLEDEIRCISEYVDVVMARVYSHEDVIKMAAAAPIPVINGLSDSFHPCQALADLFTMEECYGNMKEKKIVFVGDGSNNVAASLINICAKLELNLHVLCPKAYGPHGETIEWLKKIKAQKYIKITDDFEEALKGADVLYTDTFVSMGRRIQRTIGNF